jgi:hypothetical protein
MLGLPPAAEIDVLTPENAASYWERSDQFDLALDLSGGQRGVAALAQVIERWIAHMLAIEVTVEPLIEMQEARFTWYVGLDAEGTRIGDALWQGEDLDETARGRVLALFRLSSSSPALARDLTEGESVYLILAMTEDKMLRLKPQNLLTGLPLRQSAGVT